VAGTPPIDQAAMPGAAGSSAPASGIAQSPAEVRLDASGGRRAAVHPLRRQRYGTHMTSHWERLWPSTSLAEYLRKLSVAAEGGDDFSGHWAGACSMLGKQGTFERRETIHTMVHMLLKEVDPAKTIGPIDQLWRALIADDDDPGKQLVTQASAVLLTRMKSLRGRDANLVLTRTLLSIPRLTCEPRRRSQVTRDLLAHVIKLAAQGEVELLSNHVDFMLRAAQALNWTDAYPVSMHANGAASKYLGQDHFDQAAAVALLRVQVEAMFRVPRRDLFAFACDCLRRLMDRMKPEHGVVHRADGTAPVHPTCQLMIEVARLPGQAASDWLGELRQRVLPDWRPPGG
jgi:hypothetical protein